MSLSSVRAQNFDWQGHRGCRGIMPENTLEAFVEALNYPVTTLELDVVISKDKQVVVSHEPWMSKKICMLNGKEILDENAAQHNIYLLDYEQIREYDCGVKPNESYPYQKKIKAYKPLLADVFNTIEPILEESNRKVGYNIEIKSHVKGDGVYHPEIEEFTDLVVALIREHIPDSRYTIQSFDMRVLEYCHKTYPEVQLAMLVEGGTLESNMDKISFKPDIYSPYHGKLKKKDIDLGHDMGIKTIPWTVNTPGKMRKLIKMGVDGIITDYPNLIAEFN